MRARRPPPSLAGRVVVVTGAARGLGAELARQLSAAGARVALLGLEPAGLADVSAQCPGSAWEEVDVTDSAALAAAAAAVRRRFGRVDAVVANAGIAAGGTLLVADPDAYDRVITVNLLGSVRTVRAFLPAVVEARGYVLQVASLAAMAPAPMMSAYCASKSGVEAFAHALRGEVAHHGVDVGVAYLTWTDTDMVRGGDELLEVGDARSRLPWPLGVTYPLAPAAARVVDGLARRRPHVYAQPWVRGVQVVRAALPAVTGRWPNPRLPEVERRLRAAGPAATGAVGPGGAADRQRPARPAVPPAGR